MIEYALNPPKSLVPFLWAAFALGLFDGARNWSANGLFGITEPWVITPLFVVSVLLSLATSVFAVLAIAGLARGDR